MLAVVPLWLLIMGYYNSTVGHRSEPLISLGDWFQKKLIISSIQHVRVLQYASGLVWLRVITEDWREKDQIVPFLCLKTQNDPYLFVWCTNSPPPLKNGALLGFFLNWMSLSLTDQLSVWLYLRNVTIYVWLDLNHAILSNNHFAVHFHLIAFFNFSQQLCL